MRNITKKLRKKKWNVEHLSDLPYSKIKVGDVFELGGYEYKIIAKWKTGQVHPDDDFWVADAYWVELEHLRFDKPNFTVGVSE